MISILIATVPALQGRVQPCEWDDTIQRIASVSVALSTRSRETTALTKLDAYDLSPDEIRTWLLSLEVSGQVTILWPTDREGAILDYSDFVAHYDDLWFPSRDDVWVLTSDQRLIELDHEEMFSVFDLR